MMKPLIESKYIIKIIYEIQDLIFIKFKVEGIIKSSKNEIQNETV
jgi:hypothetical protein